MSIRIATESDLPYIIEMLADDPLGSHRESTKKPIIPEYRAAFQQISDDPNHHLVVYEAENEVIGTLQLSMLPNMTYKGSWRAQIEGVRVRKDFHGQGIGQKMIQWAIEQSKEKGAFIVQLTTDKKRPTAKLFYEKMGFQATHEGMKLKLI